jgi:hypothetical protein
MFDANLSAPRLVTLTAAPVPRAVPVSNVLLNDSATTNPCRLGEPFLTVDFPGACCQQRS